MTKVQSLAVVALGVCICAVPVASQAHGRSSFGFSINTGPAYYAPPPPPPVYVAPVVAPPPVYYQPVYTYPAYAYPRPASGFSFSYYGR